MRKLFWLALTALVVVGCSKDDPKPEDTADAYKNAIEQAQDVADMAKNRVSEGSRQVQGRGAAALPKGFPIFPGAAPNPEVPRTDQFRWDTAKSIQEVGDYYESELGKGNFGVFQSMRASTKAQVVVFKETGGVAPMGRVSLKPGPDGEGTTILLHLD